MLKILIAGDEIIKNEIIKEYVNKSLSTVDESLEIITLEWTVRGYQKKKLQDEGEIIEEFSGDPEKLIEHMNEVDILIVHTAPVTSKVMDASNRLKVIACLRGGPVNVNVKAATRRKIPVIYTPGRNARAVAEFTFGLILSLTRNIVRAHERLRRGIWSEYHEMSGPELFEKTIGIIGFGHIGRLVASIARGFGMKILVYDPYVEKSTISALGYKLVELDTLLKESDIITIHARLTRETEKMIGEREFSLMKKTAYIINTSRGRIIDQRALYKALKNRQIAGAALDVFEIEPLPPDDPLLSLENIVLTPHIAGSSTEVADRAAKMISEDLKRILTGGRPKYCINPEVLDL